MCILDEIDLYLTTVQFCKKDTNWLHTECTVWNVFVPI